MNIQIVSDLHLEFLGPQLKYNILKPSAPILALLGDICCCVNESDFILMKQFLAEISPKYEIILWIPGNHEFYHNTTYNKNITIQKTLSKMQSFCKTLPNVILLNNKTITLKKKYTIIGSTLWTNVPTELYANIHNAMNDYNHIYTNDNPITKLTPEYLTSMHKKCLAFIKRSVTAAVANKCIPIVFTHHRPHAITKSGEIPYMEYAYCCRLDEYIKSSNIALWAFGHTHVRCDEKLGKCRMYSMPKGYKFQHTYFIDNSYVCVA